MEKIEISTLGCCVTRDIFRISDNEKKFKLKGNIGLISPISMFTKRVENSQFIIDKINDTDISAFDKRNAILDIEGLSFKYLIDNKSDYLCLDLADIRIGMLKGKNNEFVTVRDNNALTNSLNLLYELGFEKVNISDYSLSQIYTFLDQLCEKILLYWKPNQIFLVNTTPAHFLFDNNVIVYSEYICRVINSYPYYIKHMTIINEYVKRKLGCYMISLPPMQFVGVNKNHTFGVNPFHYIDDVYRYLYYQICEKIFSEKKDYYSTLQFKTLKKIKQDYYRNLSFNCVTTLDEGIIELCSVNNLRDYLVQLNKLENCLVVFSVKDTIGSYFDKNMQDLFLYMGLCEPLIKQYMKGYIAVIKSDIVIFEKKAEFNECVEYIDDVDFVHLSISSKPYQNGNCSKIAINGKDYSLNNRGINIVVYDLNSQRVVDSVSFDTHSKSCFMRRKKDLLNEQEVLRVELRKFSRS